MLKLRCVGLANRWKLVQALGKKLSDQAAFVAAENDAGVINSLDQLRWRFEGKQLLRVGLNVNCHVVLPRDDTVLSRRETPVYDWDLSDA
jgi:hypothetical protein